MRRVAAALALMLMAAPAFAQSATSNSSVTPATPTDRAHHHKAYAVAKYGISCPGDRVVWVNTNSGVYHLEGERWFGRTAAGQYECEKAAKAEGDRETRNGQ
jgi:hypothetical protein